MDRGSLFIILLMFTSADSFWAVGRTAEQEAREASLDKARIDRETAGIVREAKEAELETAKLTLQARNTENDAKVKIAVIARDTRKAELDKEMKTMELQYQFQAQEEEAALESARINAYAQIKKAQIEEQLRLQELASDWNSQLLSAGVFLFTLVFMVATFILWSVYINRQHFVASERGNNQGQDASDNSQQDIDQLSHAMQVNSESDQQSTADDVTKTPISDDVSLITNANDVIRRNVVNTGSR